MKLYWKHGAKEVLGSDGVTHRAKIEKLGLGKGAVMALYCRTGHNAEWVYKDQFFTLDAAMRVAEDASVASFGNAL